MSSSSRDRPLAARRLSHSSWRCGSTPRSSAPTRARSIAVWRSARPRLRQKRWRACRITWSVFSSARALLGRAVRAGGHRGGRAIAARGRRAIVVGGTGFMSAHCAGDVSLSNAYDPQLRAPARARGCAPSAGGAAPLVAVARSATRCRPSQRGCAIASCGALEIALSDASAARGRSGEAGGLRAGGHPVPHVVLDVEHAALDAAIAARVDRMLARGLVEEAERVGRRRGCCRRGGVSRRDRVRSRLEQPRRTAFVARAPDAALCEAPAHVVPLGAGGAWVERDAALGTVSRLARELPGWG